jgi:diamine N-acetyltransferase
MIRGQKTFLRPPVSADIELMVAWENLPEVQAVSEHTGTLRSKDIEDFLTQSKDLFTDGQMRLIICHASTHEAVGIIDVFDYNPVLGKAGVGILIGDSENRGKGMASDALKALMNFGRSTLKLKRIECLIFPENEPSIKLFEQNGFKPRGIEFYKQKKAVRYAHETK